MKNNTYKEEFSNYMQIMNEALDKEDFRTYGTVRMMLDEAVEERKNDKALEDELNTSNFGILNHIFEQRLPELFKKDKKAVRDVIKTIKEDNNLLSQFNYYNSIRNYHGSITGVLKPEGMVQRLNETVLPSIDRETLAKSNKKFRKTLEEHRIVPNEMISEEMRRLYESGHNILSKNHGNVANLGVIAESTKNIFVVGSCHGEP